jgi:hypothetical protein
MRAALSAETAAPVDPSPVRGKAPRRKAATTGNEWGKKRTYDLSEEKKGNAGL